MRGNTIEKAAAAAFVLGLMFLAYVAGSLTTLMDTFPSTYIRDAYRAADALALKYDYRDQGPYATNLWLHAGDSPRGVTVHDKGAAQPGLTLYSSGEGARAVLVDMAGRTVHEWRRPFYDIWDDTAAVRDPVPEDRIYFRKALALPGGDLLAIYIGYGDTPWGYGMVKLDKDSNVLWKNLDRFHHDFAVSGDGRIYGLTHEFRKRPIEHQGHLPPPMLEDFLVVLSPDGETLSKISLLDAIKNSKYARELWRIMHFSLWDPLHTNSVKLLTEQTAEALRTKIPVAAAGQVLLSFRELDGGTIALLDVDTEEVVWATSGSWKSQHDPDILANGNILMFDNLGHFGPGQQSRVIEVDPATTGVVWSYAGDAEKPLNSPWRAAQEPLSNGNILITESGGGRIVEINRKGDVVWEYINPVRGGEDDTAVPVVSWASRLEPETAAGILNAVRPRPARSADKPADRKKPATPPPRLRPLRSVVAGG